MELRDRPMDRITHLVVLKGELDAEAAPTVQDRLMKLFDEGKRFVIVDLTGVSSVAGAGLRALVEAGFQSKQRGGRLVMHSMSTAVSESFALAGLTTLFSVAPSREAAVATVAQLRTD